MKKITKKVTKKPFKLVLKVNPKCFPVKDKALLAAAKKVMKEIDNHFKVDSYGLDLDFYVSMVFQEAYKDSLSNYLLNQLFSKGLYQVTYGEGKALITKSKAKQKK